MPALNRLPSNTFDMPLSSLPVEVVRIVLETCSDDPNSLFNLALVDRSLNREAEVVLYRVVSFLRNNASLLGFITTILNFQQRANLVHTLDITPGYNATNSLYRQISTALGRLSNLQKFSFRSQALLQNHALATWILKDMPSSLVSLDVDLDCSLIAWDLLKSLDNLRHLGLAVNQTFAHICQFPTGIVPRLSSFSGCLSCVMAVVSTRPVTTLTIMNNMNISFLSELLTGLTTSRVEITSMKFTAGIELGISDAFFTTIAKMCPSLAELEISFSHNENDQLLDSLKNWGPIFRLFKCLRKIFIATGSLHAHDLGGAAGLIVRSWAEDYPPLTEVDLHIYNDIGHEELCYYRDQSGRPGVLTTKSSIVDLVHHEVDDEDWRLDFDWDHAREVEYERNLAAGRDVSWF